MFGDILHAVPESLLESIAATVNSSGTAAFLTAGAGNKVFSHFFNLTDGECFETWAQSRR